MALIVGTGQCKHCEQSITLRRYASGNFSCATVDLWVTGNGAFPGDQRICESHIIDDDIGSYGFHEPTNVS